MSKKLTILILFLVGVLSFSCSRPEPQVNNDEYYVEYSLQISKVPGYINRTADIVFSFIDEYSNTQLRRYIGVGGMKDTVICGPFKRGDKIIASCSVESQVPYTHLIEIYVSKNNSPFALKSSGEVIEYTIDF